MSLRVVLPLVLLLAGPATVDTDHYQLTFEGMDDAQAGAWGHLLDQAWSTLDDELGKRPKLGKGEKLGVRLHVDRDQYVAAVGEDPGAPAAWRASDGSVDVFLPSLGAEGRTALVWGAALQMWALGPCKGEPPPASWYTRGLMLYLSTHAWDGRKLEPGVAPLVAPVDLVGGAKRALSDGSFDLAAAIAGEQPMPDAMAWALVRWLATGRKGKPQANWGAFKRKADAGQTLGQLFGHEFGEPADMRAEFLNWLIANPQAFVAVRGDWSARGADGIHAEAEGLGLCPSANPAREIQAVIRVPTEKKRWLGGFLMHYEDPANYSIFLIDWAGHLRAHRFVKGSRQIMEQGPGPGPDPDGTYKLRMFRERGGVYVMLGTASYGPYELPGDRFGLAVDGCSLDFTDVKWR